MQQKSGPITFSSTNLDKAGITCSSACTIHCLLLPILAYTFPTLSNFVENKWIHLGLLIALVPIALIAFKRSLNIHRNPNPFIFGGIGILLLITAIIFENIHIEILFLEKILTTIGSILLILGHFLNMKYLKRSKKI